MRGLKSLCIFTFVCVASQTLTAQPFFLRKDIQVGPDVSSVVIGDFNGDHRPDISVFTLNSITEGAFTLLNQGGGSFSKPIRSEVYSGSWQAGLPLAADFNGDGKDDLLTSEGVFLSRGDGTFEAGQQINKGAFNSIGILAAGDFNQDGKSDLIISGFSSGTHFMQVLLSNGDGTFRSGQMLTNIYTVSATVGDFNRDGHMDMLCVGFYEYKGYAAFLGNGDGTFGQLMPINTESYGEPSDNFIVADFNGDGTPDLAVAPGILLSNGNGTFQRPIAYPFKGDFHAALTAADFNGDRKADLVVTRTGSSSILIFPGKGDGTFLAPIEQAVGLASALSGAAADLDGDGLPDLVIANDSASTVSLLMAKAESAPELRRAVSAASGTAIVAPQSLATLLVATPASPTEATPPWPNTLDGIILQVQDNTGWSYQAPLLYVSPTQINFQVPAETAAGEATLTIGTHNGPIQAGSVQIDAVAPALFMASPNTQIPAATSILVKPSGDIVSIPVFTCAGEGACQLAPIPLSTADGPIYLSFYATGFRGASSDNVTCTINNSAVPVLYAGPQATPGVDQINVRLLPEIHSTFANAYEVVIRIDGVAANTAMLNIR